MDTPSSTASSTPGTPNTTTTTTTTETQKGRNQRQGVRQSALEGFGGRVLADEAKVFEQNAWDNAEWTQEAEDNALAKVAVQRENPVAEAEREAYSAGANEFWDKFYSNHAQNFFMDRHWLRQEFPELFKPTDGSSTLHADGSKKTVFEIGCGAGNTAFPLLAEDPSLFVYAADFSSTAVKVVQENPVYNESQCKAFVYDVTSKDGIPPEIPRGSVDICVCIFVLSALNPRDWAQAAQNIYDILKPGGICLFRDYGRYDMAQLRFKKGRLLDENFYIRGDGTQVYFFAQDEVSQFFHQFETVQNVVDRRLLVNRSRQVKMYRVWMQGKFRKPLVAAGEPAASE
ncbi:Methyltransferase-like protein 2-A [Podochytrium sp. JEL0797]|nr:Methyltransferase-like protein 2-A [Podochytrium sp. JEL0797]